MGGLSHFHFFPRLECEGAPSWEISWPPFSLAFAYASVDGFYYM